MRSTRPRPDYQISQAETPALVARSSRNPSTFHVTFESGPKIPGESLGCETSVATYGDPEMKIQF